MKTTAYIFVLFFISILFSNCSVTQKQNKLYKQITGVTPVYAKTDSSVFIINKGDLIIPNGSFYYMDSCVFGAQHMFSLKKDTPVFLFLKSPTFVRQLGSTQNFFYVYPTCKLKAFQNKDGYIEFKDLNGNRETNNEINFFQKLMFSLGIFNGTFPIQYYYLDSVHYTTDIFYKIETEFYNLKNKRLLFLDSVTAKAPVSKHFKELAKRIISDVSLQDSLLFILKFKTLLTKDKLYQNELNKVLYTINNTTIFSSEFFALACNTLLNLLENKPPYKLSIYSKEEYYSSLNTARKYFKNIARDYLLTEKYIEASKKYDLTESNFDTLLQNVENINFNNYLVQTHNKLIAEQTIDSANNLIGLKGEIITVENLIAKHKGKFILLDLWASWCTPCRQNMPVLKKLEEEYKGKKIAFIYISLDKDVMRWKVASISESLNIKNSYNFLKRNQPTFIRDYNITEIPRYMLFDDTGKIVNADASGPDSFKLKQLIDDNLKN